jgi:histidine triad (HIT) family protein
VFCKLAEGENKDFIFESENFFAIRDIKPKAEGHTLIIPKKHYNTLLELPEDLGGELLSITQKVANKLIDGGFGSGFNVIMNNFPSGGQVVMHAHIHVVPRNEEDGLHTIA